MNLTLPEVVALVQRHGQISAAAREIGVPRQTLSDHYNRAVRNGLAENVPHGGQNARERVIVKGQVKADRRTNMDLPKKGKVKRYICTSAQNNTNIHAGVWQNLTALAKHYGAQILVSRFTYDKRTNRTVKPGTQAETDYDDLWYAPELTPHLADYRLQLAPGLDWCGEVNMLPTAVRPLSGFQPYTGRHSGIFPHPKFVMESIPSGKSEGTKFNYTTGTVTLRNYLQKKAGLKAQFHHCYGALLAEVDSDGNWFCRQLNADSEGVIYDLDLKIENGKVTDGHRVEAICWGDIHCAQIDTSVVKAAWSGKGCMIDTLEPRYQFMHDILDFRSRNHHERSNPHARFERFVEQQENVGEEVEQVARFLDFAEREFCKTVVVDSNHDNALERWLRESDYKSDPVNAVFFLEAQTAKYKAIRDRVIGFHLLEWAIERAPHYNVNVLFLREDESFLICPDANGGIECGIHGHLGPNGQRGNPYVFANMGRKANTGHTHSAGIVDGIYTAGLSGKKDQGYNRGPSSWSHSHIVTYPNGKRAIVTLWNGKWRA